MSQAGRFEVGNPGIADVQFIQGDTGGPVGPNGGGVIFLLGESDVVSVSGNAGTNTLTINMVGVQKVTVQTVDATPTPLFSQPVSLTSSVSIFAQVMGVQDAYGFAIFGTANGCARRVGGGAVLVGIPIVPQDNDSGGAPRIDIDVSGNNLRLLVTGEAATTYNWSAIVQIDIIDL